jgi:hypothetical protein
MCVESSPAEKRRGRIELAVFYSAAIGFGVLLIWLF